VTTEFYCGSGILKDSFPDSPFDGQYGQKFFTMIERDREMICSVFYGENVH